MENQVLQELKNRLSDIIKKVEQPIVAFDADGTLWPHDVGRLFFKYQVDKGFFKKNISDPHGEFNNICKTKGHTEALLWVAKIQKGVSLKTLNQEVQEFLQAHSFKTFLFQRDLINYLIRKKVQVFIVSASLKWILDNALQGYNIPVKNIIGVETKIEQGIITDQIIFPVSVHKQKAEAFLTRTKGVKPCFVAGNTLSDESLLELSSHLRLVVATAQKGEKNYQTETSLLKIAKNKKWFYINQMPKLI